MNADILIAAILGLLPTAILQGAGLDLSVCPWLRVRSRENHEARSDLGDKACVRMRKACS